jgi:hypothetical protein
VWDRKIFGPSRRETARLVCSERQRFPESFLDDVAIPFTESGHLRTNLANVPLGTLLECVRAIEVDQPASSSIAECGSVPKIVICRGSFHFLFVSEALRRKRPAYDGSVMLVSAV